MFLFFLDNENLIFRGNTFATKAVDTYMKMVGEAVRKREGGRGGRERGREGGRGGRERGGIKRTL